MDRELSYQAAAILRARVLVTKRAEQACVCCVGPRLLAPRVTRGVASRFNHMP